MGYVLSHISKVYLLTYVRSEGPWKLYNAKSKLALDIWITIRLAYLTLAQVHSVQPPSSFCLPLHLLQMYPCNSKYLVWVSTLLYVIKVSLINLAAHLKHVARNSSIVLPLMKKVERKRKWQLKIADWELWIYKC